MSYLDHAASSALRCEISAGPERRGPSDSLGVFYAGPQIRRGPAAAEREQSRGNGYQARAVAALLRPICPATSLGNKGCLF